MENAVLANAGAACTTAVEEKTGDVATPTLTRQSCSASASKSAAAGDPETAIAWTSRALELLALEEPVANGDGVVLPLSTAATALYLRRAEYAIQAKRLEDGLRDTDTVLSGTTEKKPLAKAVRIKCRALLAMDRPEDALDTWQSRLGMGSPVLDALAFRREFGVEGATTEDNESRYDTALQYLYRRDFGNAISLLNKTLDAAKKGKGKSKNKDPVLFLLRARCRIELKEYEGAVADCERVVTLLPTAVEAYRWLCEATIALKNYSHASRVCQLGLSIAPSDDALLKLDAQLQKSKQQREKKKTANFASAHLENGEDAEGSADRAEDEEQEGEEEEEDPAFEAIRELKKALKADPRNADHHARLAGLRFGLTQYEQAQHDAAQAIALDGASAAGYVRSCEALYALRRYAKALRVCEQGLRMVDTARATATEEMEDLRGWEAKLQDAIVEPPPEEPVEYAGPIGKSRVPKAVAARRRERAQRKVDDAQALRIKCYDKAVELADDRDFGNAVFWLNKAEGYDAASRDGDAARIVALRARCRFELKQFDHVAKDAERAVAMQPSDVDSYRWWGLALRARGYNDKARAAWTSGLAIDPTHQQLLSLVKSLPIGSTKTSA